MSEFEAFVLGLVQGLTEFLPVSSSGHLVVVSTLFGQEGEGGLVFEIALHVATLVAIVIFYRARIWELIFGVLSGKPEAWRYGCKLALASVPVGVVGLTAKPMVEELFGSPWVTGVCLMVTGVIVWSTRDRLRNDSKEEPSWKAVALIGCAQAFAILPGISRSGSTVAAALALGIAPAVAAEFSFLLGVIAISGAAVLSLGEIAATPPEMIASLVIGSIAALISGLGALWLFIQMLRNDVFHLFAFYAWTVGASFMLWLALR